MYVEFDVDRFRASLLKTNEFPPRQVEALCDAFAEAFAGHLVRFHSAIGAAPRRPAAPPGENGPA